MSFFLLPVRIARHLGLVAVSALLATCGGSHREPITALEGRFVDGPVQGLEYKTATITGATGPNGEFKYLQGETVEFSLGNTVLGSTAGAPIVTPVTLVPGAVNDLHSYVGNIAQLLQSLDDDGDHENGIQITAETRALAATRTVNVQQSSDAFTADPSVADLVSASTANSSAGPRPLVTRIEAQLQLRNATNWQPSQPCPQIACFRVVEMWSHQFQGVVSNGFSEVTNDRDAGHAGNRRASILMSARADNIAHFKVGIVGAGDTMRALVRLTLHLASESYMVGASYPLRAGTMDLSIDLNQELPVQARQAGPLDFTISVGVDLDGRGELDSAEALGSSAWRFQVVPEWHYFRSVSHIQSRKGILPALTRDIFDTFLTGQAPSNFPPRNDFSATGAEQVWASIRALHKGPRAIFNPATEIYPFSHRVGIDFRRFDHGFIGLYQFGSTSTVAAKLERSRAFENEVVLKLIALAEAGVPLPNVRTAFRFGLFEPELDLTGR